MLLRSQRDQVCAKRPDIDEVMDNGMILSLHGASRVSTPSIDSAKNIQV